MHLNLAVANVALMRSLIRGHRTYRAGEDQGLHVAKEFHCEVHSGRSAESHVGLLGEAV